MIEMRIEQINIKNFRQYKKVQIDFPDYYDNDIHVIIGKNGVGKTTLFNAINWCLYGKEPNHLSNGESLRILNSKIPDDSNDKEVFVEIKVEVNENNKYIFKRTIINPIESSESFLEVMEFNNGESTFIESKQNEIFVNKFVNESIKEFYFFDGERLDTYFKEDHIGRIRSNIHKVSKINILENTKRHLKDKIKELEKKSGDIAPNMAEIKERKDFYESKINELTDIITKNNLELSKMKNEEEKISNDLAGTPNVNEIQSIISNLEKSKENKNQTLKSKLEKINEINYNYGTSIFLYDAINNLSNEINTRYEKNELPPIINTDLIQESIKKHICSVCGHDLNEQDIKHLNDTLDDDALTNKELKLLIKLKSPLDNEIKRIKEYENIIEDLHKDSDKLNEEINEIEKEIEINKQKIFGLNNDVISEKYERLNKLKNRIDETNIKLGADKSKKDDYSNKLNDKEKEFTEARKLHDESKIYDIKIDLCHKALNVYDKTINEIMYITKENIENFTNKTFLSLLWKKETYDHISIDDNYTLKLIHVSGKNALGSASAAERALLALSYTLGIHSVSGYNSPLIIDTPLARVSDEHRKNFSKSLIEVSKNKQIILLFTPDEFSDNIKGLFEDYPKYNIIMNEQDQSSDIILGGI